MGAGIPKFQVAFAEEGSFRLTLNEGVPGYQDRYAADSGVPLAEESLLNESSEGVPVVIGLGLGEND